MLKCRSAHISTIFFIIVAVALCMSCCFCYWPLGCWLSTLRNKDWTEV